MSDLRFFGEVKNRQFVMKGVQRKAFDNYVKMLTPGPYCFDFKKYYEERTGAQRRYYYLLIGLFADEIGEPRHIVDGMMKALFLMGTKIIKLPDGSEMEIPYVKSIADKANGGDTDVVEMIDLIDKVMHHILDMFPEFRIPDPDEWKRMKRQANESKTKTE